MCRHLLIELETRAERLPGGGRVTAEHGFDMMPRLLLITHEMQRRGQDAIGHHQVHRVGRWRHDGGEPTRQGGRHIELPVVEAIDPQPPQRPQSIARVVESFRQLEREPGMTVAVCPVRPDSRGTIMAQSPDPLQYPAIRPNYLSAPSDLRVLKSGFEQTRKIFAQPAMAPYSVEETVPGPGVQTDEQFADFAKKNGTNVFHPVGTCKMGTDNQAVVDPELRVRGLEGLRVVDASIMPTLVGGNTNAPTIMIAEKAADLIRARH